MANRETPPVAFSLRKLRAGFPGNLVLKGLDWDLEEGESFALLGPSGQGKTLFCKLLAGLLVPVSGTVSFFGKDINKMSSSEREKFRSSIGMTFQKDGLFDSLTCADNLRFPLTERGKMTAGEREKRVAQGLEDVGLGGQGRLYVHEMSGGMQKRLGIARALLFSPQVLIYDEPAAGLDPITALAINELIGRMRERHHMSIVLVTSDLTQAQQTCSKMGLLWKGKFEQEGTFAELESSRNPAVHQFFRALPEGPLTEFAQ